ncbi:MAG: carbon storage regulator, partial [Planctomycetota bacterium]
MLVLSRKISQTIRLPEADVTVTVTGVSGRTVKLGIDAPPSIAVLRGEREENRRQAVDAPPAATKTAEALSAAAQPDLKAMREALHRLTLNLALAEHEGQVPSTRVGAMYEQLTRATDALSGVEKATQLPGRPAPPVSKPVGRVLLVSSDKEERTLLASLLSQWGVAVETANGATAAAERILDRHATAFDLILADLPESSDEAIHALTRLREADRFQETRRR